MKKIQSNKSKKNIFLRNTLVSLSATALGMVGTIILRDKLSQQNAKKHNVATTHIDMHTATLSFGKIAYKTTGIGQPILLLHDFYMGASHDEWNLVFDELSKNYQVFALDFIGFGNSEKPEKPWTAYQYAGCVQEFCKKIIGDSAYIIGSNAGADIALVTSMLYPEVIKDLVLISPIGFYKGFATNEEVESLQKYLSPLLGTELFLQYSKKSKLKQILENKFFAKENLSTQLLDTAFVNAHLGKYNQTTFATLQTGLWRADTTTGFCALTLPFALFWGEENIENPTTYYNWAENRRPDGYYVIFEEVGNFPHLENPTAFLSVVNEYL